MRSQRTPLFSQQAHTTPSIDINTTEAIEFVKSSPKKTRRTQPRKDEEVLVKRAHLPWPLDSVQRMGSPITGWGGRSRGELAARLAHHGSSHFASIIILLRLDQMGRDDEQFAHDRHHRHAFFHASTHQTMVIDSKGGGWEANAAQSC